MNTFPSKNLQELNIF